MTVTPPVQSGSNESLTPLAPNTVPVGPPTKSLQPPPTVKPPATASAFDDNGVTISTSLASRMSVVKFQEEGQWTGPDGDHIQGREQGTIRQINIAGSNGQPGRTVDVEHLRQQAEIEGPDGGRVVMKERQITMAFVVLDPLDLLKPAGPVGPTPADNGTPLETPQATAVSAYARTGQIGTNG